MFTSFLTAVGAMVGLMLAWVGVQSLWRKTFSDYVNDEDVLAERRSCGNCGCITICENKKKEVQQQ